MSSLHKTSQHSDSDPSYAKLETNDLPWYTEDVEGQLLPETRSVFETYSQIRPEEVVSHISLVRSKLWNIHAYPCTGLYVFLVPWIRYHPAFNQVVTSILSTNAKVLDVGCYIGHDLRALRFEGVPQTSLFGLDIVDFLTIGNELFQDFNRFNMDGRFVVGDILDGSSDSEAAQLLDGKMDVVWCSAILHQFTWDKAVTACMRLIQYSKGSDAMIIGAIVGSSVAEGSVDMKGLTRGRDVGSGPFKHDARSLERLWGEVGTILNLELRITTSWKPWKDWGCNEDRCKVMGPDYGILEWTVHVP